ncbi:flagellar hook-length control protein FliK [Roseivivax sp. CAU 1753]
MSLGKGKSPLRSNDQTGFDALVTEPQSIELPKPEIEAEFEALPDDIKANLLEAIKEELSQIATNFPPDDELSPAGWDRVDKKMIGAVVGAFHGASMELPAQLVAGIDATLTAAAKSFEARASELLKVVEGALARAEMPGLGRSTVEATFLRPASVFVAAQKSASPSARLPDQVPKVKHMPDTGVTNENSSRSKTDRALPVHDAGTRHVTVAPDAAGTVVIDRRLSTLAPSAGQTVGAPPSRSELQGVAILHIPQAQVVQSLAPEAVQALKPEMSSPSTTEANAKILAQFRGVRVAEGRTRIELSPAHLGALDIELSSDEAGQLRVMIRAESPVTLAALRSDRQGLADVLSANGLDFDGTHLELEGYDQDERPPSQHDTEHPLNELLAMGETALTAEDNATETRYRTVPLGRLDILT